MEFEILQATNPEDHDKVEKFLGKVFVPDLPFFRVFGIDTTTFSESPPPEKNKNRDDSAKHRDFTLKAVDPSGDIIGVAVNAKHPEHPPPSTEMKELEEFFNFIDVKMAGLRWERDDTMELCFLAVREDWRGRGVARRLAEESARVARSLGFNAIKVCCTSEFTAKVARGLGWQEVYRLAYADYPALSGRQVTLTPNPPHDHVYYYLYEFENSKTN